ncbi:MAG: hypothetical protein ACLTLM_12805 [Oscillospiraceae bacterium]
MAEKRMFTKSIIDSDAFLEMPLSAQALYFHLNMRADDDGFVNNPKRITDYVNASADDLKILLAKRFIIRFDSGVIVIKHWRMHNTLKSDRYHPTDYQDELALLCVKPNKAYTEKPQVPEIPPAPLEPEWNQSGTNLEPQVRVVESSKGLGKDSEGLDEAREDLSVPSAEPETVSAPPIISIILNDKTFFNVFPEDYNRWCELYPAVNVMQELRKMSSWSTDNPKRRKTKSGIRRFINAWLSKEQDKGGQYRYQGGSSSGNVFTDLAEGMRNGQA